jgi:hypothetical protein
VVRPLIVLCCLLAIPQVAPAPQNAASGAAIYEAYAIRFGTLTGFSVSSLVAGADRSRKLDIPVMVWLLKGTNGHTVLVDSGFYPHATIWIQRDEYTYYTGEAWHARNTHGGVFAEDMLALLKINTEGRLRFVNGDDQEVLPGIRAYIGGKHTYQSQYVTVKTDAGTVVFASDNIYLYENLEKHVPIAQTLDAASNLRAQDRIRSLASNPRLIVPGHEPLVFDRFPSVGDGIVRIK